GLPLLPQAEDRVEQRQEDQYQAGLELLDRVKAHDARHQQHDLHRIRVLADERAPPGLLLGLGELVGAEPLGPRRHLGRAQAALRVDLLGLEDLAGAERVPDGAVGPGRRAGRGRPGWPAGRVRWGTSRLHGGYRFPWWRVMPATPLRSGRRRR